MYNFNFDKNRIVSKKLIDREKNSENFIKDEFEKIANDMRLQGKSERTISDYGYHLEKLCEKNGISLMPELNRDALVNYLSDTSIADSTKLIRLKSVRAILNRFYHKGLIKEEFWSDISIRVAEQVKEGTTERELNMLLYLLDFTSFVEFRDACAILMIWETGARAGTIARITEDMIDHKTLVINFSGEVMKNYKSLSLPISQDLSDMLTELMIVNKKIREHNKTTNNLLFISTNGISFEDKNYTNLLTKRISKYKKRFGLKHINAHALRRGFAKRLLDKGVSVPIISRALNHSSLDVTTKYLYIDNEEVIDSIRNSWEVEQND